MAGHSQFKNIMHRKGAQDAKRAKMFTKVIREITVAAREGGGDPQSNPRLRQALLMAREYNMPKDNVERAIQKATSPTAQDDYQEARYEGYGPQNVALIVEALTDNRNRTASEIRTIFNKAGGRLGESVDYLFERKGILVYELCGSFDDFFEQAASCEAEDVVASPEHENRVEVHVGADALHTFRSTFLTQGGSEPLLMERLWQPFTPRELPDKMAAESVQRFIQNLEDLDDVQRVFHDAVLCDWLSESEE